jgi:uncharacterized protein (TIGR03663 family)
MQKLFNTPLDQLVKRFTIRDFFIVLVLLLAVLSRFIGLGDRVMSHDEVNHVVPAYDLFAGRGYRHDPITHGPLQFHLMGLSYFMFGDNDFTSRLPHAIFSILTIAFVMVAFRRYLGSYGSVIAGVLFTISPFMLFYGRYARNDAICVFLGVVSIYAFLRYFETRNVKYILFLTVSLALNFTTKETAYIFSAQLLLFVLLLFALNVIKIKIADRKKTTRIISANILLVLLIIILTSASVLLFRQAYMNDQQTAATALLTTGSDKAGLAAFVEMIMPVLSFILPGTIPLILVIVTILILKKHLRWDLLSQSPAFSVLILIGTLVLPLLAPFLVRFAGMNPSAYSEPLVIITNYIFITALFFVSYILGSEWDQANWWKWAVIFYGIYVVLYSTFFTNPVGLMTGMIGSLGHWLDQHPVQRGGQPWYYYAFFLVPFYEFLSVFGGILAFYFGISNRSFWRRPFLADSIAVNAPEEINEESQQPFTFTDLDLIPDPAINIYLFITSFIAYSIAGEKMPWLSLHIVLPLIFAASWSFNIVFEKLNNASKNNDWYGIAIFFGLFLNSVLLISKALGNQPPFLSQTQKDLQSTYHFLFLCFIEIGLIVLLVKSKLEFSLVKIKNYLAVNFIIFFGVLTARTSFQAAFINYDNAKEFLVYAHAADGPKRVLEQVEEISRRTTNGLDIKVAYDNHGLYPFWWYLRHYPNKIVYLENPTRSLEEAPLIIAGQDKYAKLEPIIRDNYYFYEYMRLWWPMQDYWNLNWERISSTLGNRDMRQALKNIWLDRDYALYAQVKGNQNLTLETWLPSEKMRLYIRKDIAAQMWQYINDGSFQLSLGTDPYADKLITRSPDGFISMEGSLPGELNTPRGLDVGSDGLIYVADSRNHRIQVFSQYGSLENVWGVFANVLEGDAPGGTFNEPWDVAVGDDGSVFVADTFNHRIQKFDKNGRFIKMWGTFAQGQDPESFWGPRGIDIDQNGNVLVTDTGNKRVVVFDSDLNFITQFGGGGFSPGQFDEPVGITVSKNNNVIIADTWNRRVQIFESSADGLEYKHILSFDIDGWFGQGIDNKPYLAADSENRIYISDPEAGRILVFDAGGELIEGFQDLNTTEDLISYPYGLAFDPNGRMWFSDASSNILAYIDFP